MRSGLPAFPRRQQRSRSVGISRRMKQVQTGSKYVKNGQNCCVSDAITPRSIRARRADSTNAVPAARQQASITALLKLESRVIQANNTCGYVLLTAVQPVAVVMVVMVMGIHFFVRRAGVCRAISSYYS